MTAKTSTAKNSSPAPVKETPARTAFVPVIKKRLTFPQLKLKLDIPIVFMFSTPWKMGKEIEQSAEDKAAGKAKKQPPMVAKGINLETGEECELIVNAVAQSVLTEEYPNDGYVGKGFQLTKLPKVSEDKQYFPFEVLEVELPE